MPIWLICLCIQGRSDMARSTVSFGRKRPSAYRLWTGVRTIRPSGRVLRAQVHRNRTLCLGNVNVTHSRPVIEGSEDEGGRRDASGHKKGAIHDLISSLCTSGKNGTRAGRGCEPRPMPRSQSSRCEVSGLEGV